MDRDPADDAAVRSPSFKVVDRRRFTSGGEVRPGGAAALDEDRRRPVPTLSAPPPGSQNAAVPAAPGPQRSASRAVPPAQRSQVDFMAFIASLATNAMSALGLMPEGQSPSMPFNPAMAREYIEIIAMLQERTEGNVSDDEAHSLARLMSDLRLNYVEVTQSAQAPAPPPGYPQNFT